MAANGQGFSDQIAAATPALLGALIGGLAAITGVFLTIDHQIRAQDKQFTEDRERTAEEQKADVYSEYLRAADASYHASLDVALAQFYCREPNDEKTCDHFDAQYLAVIDKQSDAIVAYRDMENQVYVFGSTKANDLAERLGRLLEEHFLVPTDGDTPNEYSRLQEDFFTVMCEEVPAIRRDGC